MRISDWSSDVCSSDLLGATMVMGTQQAGVREDRQVDGVFAMWYGKGPGVDRAGDAIHHGHAAGASRHGARKSVVEGKSVAVRVDLGGRRIIKKKITDANTSKHTYINNMTNIKN